MHNLLISGMSICGELADFALRESVRFPDAFSFDSRPGYLEWWEKEEWLASVMVWSYPTTPAPFHSFR